MERATVQRACLERYRRVGAHQYRGHRLEVLDDGAAGWAVRIWGPDPPAGQETMLRNKAPKGLSALIAEAKRQVDRRLDGSTLPG